MQKPEKIEVQKKNDQRTLDRNIPGILNGQQVTAYELHKFKSSFFSH